MAEFLTKGSSTDAFAAALEQLRAGLAALDESDDLRVIEESREKVYERFGSSFSGKNLPHLTADEYTDFLRFENNRHWTGINRHGSRTAKDMDSLRQALAVLVDEDRSISDRYNLATGGMVTGMGRAIATAILHVVYPRKYGVWNSRSEAGLRELDVFPKLPGNATDGEQYAAVNDVLLRLASELNIDLWTLDTLWEWLPRQPKLASPFDAIFADRAQAEWAFDLFAETVEWLGGGPDDPRFSLTLRQDRNRMRLNIGNSMVIDIADHGREVNLTALIDEMERTYQFERPPSFRVTVKGTSREFGVYTIPYDLIQKWPAELQAIFKLSMEEFGKEFSSWERSNLRLAHHNEEIFAALFDEAKRDDLLSGGLPPPPENGTSSIARDFTGFTMDAFAFMRELQENNNKAWMDAHRERWQESVQEPMRALFADLGPAVKPVFDRYLSPDALEVKKDILARIYKNWAATPDSAYHPYYWGAFYREGLKRQTDAQLHATIHNNYLRIGFFIGESAESLRDRFRRRILDDLDGFCGLINRLGLVEHGFEFGRGHEEEKQDIHIVRSVDDVRRWVESGEFRLLVSLTPNEAVSLGPTLADLVHDTFRRVFPVYLWAVAEDPLPLIERYLDAEFPPEDGVDETIEILSPYALDDFRHDTHLTHEYATELLDTLKEKKQLIFTGPPGTGKTWVAQHLARLLTGLAGPPPERLTIVQFHPAYAYEEFIEGIRPKRVEDDDGRGLIDYPVLPGAFVRFCREAARTDAPCVFIIDEINRGNIPRIFGELMLLLEYRDLDIPLPYSGKRFHIPPNVYLIGTMNTADRSIALVDFALRRRFQFFEFEADPDLFDRWLGAHPLPDLPYLSDLYSHLTKNAIDDQHFRIGPSTFMDANMDEKKLERVWRRSIMPYLREYHFEQPANAARWDWERDIVSGIRQAWLNRENGGLGDQEIVGRGD